MQRVEKHIIKKSHPYYEECDRLCFLSKNVYNSGLYYFRQEFIHNGNSVSYNNTYLHLRYQKDYQALPDKVSKQTLRKLENNKTAFFRSIKDWKKNPAKYTGRPNLPHYKDSIKGRFVCTYEKGAISKNTWNRRKSIGLSKTFIEVKPYKATYETIKSVRIVPKNGIYIIELIYEVPLRKLKEFNGKVASIDLGLSNLSTVTFSEKGVRPFIINGNPMKSNNQFYNKDLAKLKSELEEGQYESKRIKKLTLKRNLKNEDYLHKSSRILVNQLVKADVSRLIIGYNKGWKQGINIGKVNNQNFVSIPFLNYIEKIKYKCEQEGIEVVFQEESYTSKSSFLDLEKVCKKEKYCSYRKSRGMYKSYKHGLINADVNGSYNILRKAVPNAFADGIEGVAVHPFRLKF